MKHIKFISTILFILFYMPCLAQYDEFYKVDNNTYVTTTPDAELYELSPYKYDLLKNTPSYLPNMRDLVDVRDCKLKKIKEPQRVRNFFRVLRSNFLNKIYPDSPRFFRFTFELRCNSFGRF